MNFKIIYINIFLIILIVIVSIVIIHLWASKDLIPNSGISGTYNVNQKYQRRQVLIKNPSIIAAYSDIIDKNLFSPQRKRFVAKPRKIEIKSVKTEPVVEKIPELSTNRIKLYGVLLLNPQYRKALVTNINDRTKHGSIWVKIGDKLDNFIVDGIYNDYIIIRYKDKKFSIYLYNTEKDQNRRFIKRNKTIVKSVNNSPDIKNTIETIKQKLPQRKVTSSDEEYEYVETPFGKYKIKKRK